MLNRYFTLMSTVIVDEGGMMNKFGGDSLLAVFGTPLNPHAEHAAQAVRAALNMRAALGDFNREQRSMELPTIRFGVGIATGDVVAGNVGSSKKVEYTVIGDTVNIASRLQEMSKEFGREILVSAETAQRVADVARVSSIGKVALRGKAETVEVFAVQ